MRAINDLLLEVEAGDMRATGWGDFNVFGDRDVATTAHRAYKGSLDAAKALHEAVLPEWVVSLDQMNNGTWGADIQLCGSHPAQYAGAENSNPARAWLIAVLKAMSAHPLDT